MLKMYTTKDAYVIEYCDVKKQHRIKINFKKSLLSEGLVLGLSPLPNFATYELPSFLLTQTQNCQVNSIIQKLQDENNSDYPFSESLQNVYFLKLVHLILKIHQYAPYGCYTCLN